MKLHRLLGLAVVVISTGLAPAFAQDGPKGGGGAGGGGGNNAGGGGGVSGVSGGGNSPGGPSGGGGGGSSFGGGGGGGGGSSIGSSSSSPDWSTFRGSNRNGTGSRAGSRAAEPSYARSVSPASADSVRSSGSRSRGDRPALGQAIQRETPIDRTNRGGGGGERYDPFALGGYGYYGYTGYGSCTAYGGLYSRCFDPWYSGYGYYGLGSMFYDPSWFYGSASGMQGPPVNVSEGLGALRLKIKPNQGQVFIDSFFVGTVDEFDGPSQKIKLEQGHHRVEVRLLGYEPLMFDIEIRRGQTSTFEGQLRPRQ